MIYVRIPKRGRGSLKDMRIDSRRRQILQAYMSSPAVLAYASSTGVVKTRIVGKDTWPEAIIGFHH